MKPSPSSGIDIFLHPGEWYFGDSSTRIHTTLGSCVAVVLWHPKLKYGGMCHYMLPGSETMMDVPNAKYGNDALRIMMGEVLRLGTRPEDYEAKLFGGASMFEIGPGGSSIAERNVQAADHLVQRYRLRVTARSLGGTGYRQLLFTVDNGDVWVRIGENRQIALSHPQQSHTL